MLTDPGIPAGAEARLYFQPFTARLKRLRKKLASLKGHGFSRAASGPNAEPALAAEGMQAIENRFPRGLKPRTSFTQPVAWLKLRPFKAAKLPDRRSFSAACKVVPLLQDTDFQRFPNLPLEASEGSQLPLLGSMSIACSLQGGGSRQEGEILENARFYRHSRRRLQ